MGFKRKQEYTFICDKCGKEKYQLDNTVPAGWQVVLRGNLRTKVTGPTDETAYYRDNELVAIREYGYEASGPVHKLLCPDCI